MIAREIHTHKVNPPNDRLNIEVRDNPGAGGASHCYRVTGYFLPDNPSRDPIDNPDDTAITIHFQNGPIPEAGVNGLTQEVLLAIVQDRLECFQAGPFACEENGRALKAVKEAQHWLQFRTLKRMARGVEGTHTK